MNVADLRANFRLSKLLETFKNMTDGKEGRLELGKHHCFVLAGKEATYPGPFHAELFDTFEELFIAGDGARMDLSTLAGQDVEVRKTPGTVF